MKQKLIEIYTQSQKDGVGIFGQPSIEEMAGYFLSKKDPIFELDNFIQENVKNIKKKKFYWKKVELLVRTNV